MEQKNKVLAKKREEKRKLIEQHISKTKSMHEETSTHSQIYDSIPIFQTEVGYKLDPYAIQYFI